MLPTFIPICHATLGHPPVLWSLMAGGVAGCVFHCVGTCALCLSGGTALGAAFFKSCRMIVSRLAPALMVFGSSLLLLRQEFLFNV